MWLSVSECWRVKATHVEQSSFVLKGVACLFALLQQFMRANFGAKQALWLFVCWQIVTCVCVSLEATPQTPTHSQHNEGERLNKISLLLSLSIIQHDSRKREKKRERENNNDNNDFRQIRSSSVCVCELAFAFVVGGLLVIFESEQQQQQLFVALSCVCKPLTLAPITVCAGEWVEAAAAESWNWFQQTQKAIQLHLFCCCCCWDWACAKAAQNFSLSLSHSLLSSDPLTKFAQRKTSFSLFLSLCETNNMQNSRCKQVECLKANRNKPDKHRKRRMETQTGWGERKAGKGLLCLAIICLLHLTERTNRKQSSQHLAEMSNFFIACEIKRRRRLLWEREQIWKLVISSLAHSHKQKRQLMCVWAGSQHLLLWPLLLFFLFRFEPTTTERLFFKANFWLTSSSPVSSFVLSSSSSSCSLVHASTITPSFFNHLSQLADSLTHSLKLFGQTKVWGQTKWERESVVVVFYTRTHTLTLTQTLTEDTMSRWRVNSFFFFSLLLFSSLLIRPSRHFSQAAHSMRSRWQ